MPASEFEILEDMATEEQLNRCREMLAANLCTQGVRALSSESLPSLISKVLKIDRQHRHINTLWNYVNQLKNFAVNNAQDFAIAYHSSAIYSDGSLSSSNIANLNVAYVYFPIPTNFTLDIGAFNVASSNVVLISSEVGVHWGTSASNYFTHHYFSRISSSSLRARTFAQLKLQASYDAPGYNGTAMSSVYPASIRFSRYNDTHYQCTAYPYNTSYDYWCGNSNSYLSGAAWAVKLPQLGVAPNNLFPEPPKIPEQEFYY
jgi:hypothetical protein